MWRGLVYLLFHYIMIQTREVLPLGGMCIWSQPQLSMQTKMGQSNVEETSTWLPCKSVSANALEITELLLDHGGQLQKQVCGSTFENRKFPSDPLSLKKDMKQGSCLFVAVAKASTAGMGSLCCSQKERNCVKWCGWTLHVLPLGSLDTIFDS